MSTTINLSPQQHKLKTNHLYALDGFRALLALWVYFGHLADASGFTNRLLALHPLAVDLFMILSGFLMVYTWKQDIRTTRFISQSTLRFYIMRFFRIAPLYYLLLFVCYHFGPSLAFMHDLILKEMPPPWARDIVNYAPQTDWTFSSFQWFYTHITFLFGLFPGMENSTPLPDWSLSLEMQFYFLFPLLLVITRKLPIILFAGIISAVAFASPKLFGNYLDPGVLTHFGQPSFIPYRLNAFFAGMLAAFWLKEQSGKDKNNMQSIAILWISALISIAPLSKPVILAYLFFIAISYKRIPVITWMLSLNFMRNLGHISYSIYLCHILIIYPIVYALIQHTLFLTMLPSQRFITALAITLPLVISFSYILYRWVELPSIRIGKKFSY